MKINFLFAVLIMGIFIAISACSRAMVLKKRLPSEWNISSYEEKTVEGTASSVLNIGSIRFETNGTGTKSINFKLIDRVIEDYQPFEWKILADTVTVVISGTSYFSKAWTVLESSPSSQVWKAADRVGNTQTMVLTKNKVDTRISDRSGND